MNYTLTFSNNCVKIKQKQVGGFICHIYLTDKYNIII